MPYKFGTVMYVTVTLAVIASQLHAAPRSIKVQSDGSTVEIDPRTNKPKNQSGSSGQHGKTERHNFTLGTFDKTSYQVGPITTRSNHGNRIYCVVSHFSYDDPIIYPNQPGKAHLHMFWGSTALNAFTTPKSIHDEGSSSCEGGSNYKVGAWVPAVYNSFDEVVIPEETFIYYKLFGVSPENIARVREIPQGLGMLASADTRNFRSDNITSSFVTRNGRTSLQLNISFPSCVATDDGTMNGNPVLSFRDMPGALANKVNSHVAYPGRGNEVGCPTSHPYRFATPQFRIFFDASQTGTQPYLSSDAMAGAPPMSTLHGDYMFGSAPSVNQAILQCVQEARTCGFDGGRRQLPDRFIGPAGQLYRNSVTLLDGTDRTPFGNHLPPMRHHGHGKH